MRRPTHFKGSGHRWQGYMTFRWFQKPHWVRRSGLMYDSNTVSRYRDILDREYKGQNDCRYISPKDGKIKALVVQCVDDILTGEANGTWKRTYIRNVAPRFYRLALWPFSHVDMREGKLETQDDWIQLILKWIPTSTLLIVGVSI